MQSHLMIKAVAMVDEKKLNQGFADYRLVAICSIRSMLWYGRAVASSSGIFSLSSLSDSPEFSHVSPMPCLFCTTPSPIYSCRLIEPMVSTSSIYFCFPAVAQPLSVIMSSLSDEIIPAWLCWLVSSVANCLFHPLERSGG